MSNSVVEQPYQDNGTGCWVRVVQEGGKYIASTNSTKLYSILEAELYSTPSYGYRSTWQEAQRDLDAIAQKYGWTKVSMKGERKFL